MTPRILRGTEDLTTKRLCYSWERVGTETPVGLCVGRGIGMLTALLGVWWAGGAYVPLDPGFPAARLASMARGAGLGIILSDAAHRDLARSVADSAAVICVD